MPSGIEIGDVQVVGWPGKALDISRGKAKVTIPEGDLPRVVFEMAERCPEVVCEYDLTIELPDDTSIGTLSDIEQVLMGVGDCEILLEERRVKASIALTSLHPFEVGRDLGGWLDEFERAHSVKCPEADEVARTRRWRINGADAADDVEVFVVANGLRVVLAVRTDEDGQEYVSLESPDGANLEGAAPGVYYPTPAKA